MKCDWQSLVYEMAWEAFKDALYDKVLKTAGKRAALAIAAALADSPVPGPGDVVATILLIFGILEGIWNIGNLVIELRSLQERARRLIQSKLDDLTEAFGLDFLDNECACNCVKAYIRELIVAAKAKGRKRRLRLIKEANQRLDDCLRGCF